ncbi:UDP-N-acetylglucosamine transferase subunit ALG14 homolog [Haliotis rufescens]|uniref:UDP-N-acetylglucosamine transferase subunit ALG14 homolog n=1 Tax=Haliotis rufescens TaxID=6454 RepID=UPI00201F931C|nr:UDP-N-acetylglucosamine transferase subunit ALG14 homolog [Haliotis rufescens]
MDVFIFLILVPVCILTFLLYRIYFVKVNGTHNPLNTGKRKVPASLMVVVGSGGHTREVLCLVRQLGSHYSPRYYVIADTDKMSEHKVHALEESRKEEQEQSQYFVIRIPRSRQVKQSWVSTVLSTLYAAIYTFPVVFRRKPEIILCNGPGTCIPVCLAGLLLKWLHFQRTMIVYVESVCRVTSLSLSAKILYHFADHMFVQWPTLQQQHPKCQYIGRIV